MRDLGWIVNFSLQSPPIPNLPSPLIRDGDGDDDFLKYGTGRCGKAKSKKRKAKARYGLCDWSWNLGLELSREQMRAWNRGISDHLTFDITVSQSHHI